MQALNVTFVRFFRIGGNFMIFDGFSKRLREVIDSGKYTQKEAAERLGISEHSFTKYLNGRIPQTEILYKIALLYDTTMEWLLTGKSNSKQDKPLTNNLFSNFVEEDLDDLKLIIKFLKFYKTEKGEKEKTSIEYSISPDDDPPIAATKEEPTIYLPILGDAAAGIPIEIIELRQGKVPVNEKHGKYNSFVIRAKGNSMIDAGIENGDLVVIRPQPVVENGEVALVNINGEAAIKYFYLHNGKCELRSANPSYSPMFFTSHDISILGKVVEVIKHK